MLGVRKEKNSKKKWGGGISVDLGGVFLKVLTGRSSLPRVCVSKFHLGGGGGDCLGANSLKDCFKWDCRGMCDCPDTEGPLR